MVDLVSAIIVGESEDRGYYNGNHQDEMDHAHRQHNARAIHPSNKHNNARTFEAPTNAIVLDLVRIRRSVSSLLRKGGGGLLPDMVANAVVAILQRILCGRGCAGQDGGLVEQRQRRQVAKK